MRTKNSIKNISIGIFAQIIMTLLGFISRKDPRKLFIKPSLRRKITVIPTTTTQERKWGIYTTDCRNRLYIWFLNSFSISAKIMEIGNAKIICNMEIWSVFQITCITSESSKMDWKCFNPTQGLLRNPWNGL